MSLFKRFAILTGSILLISLVPFLVWSHVILGWMADMILANARAPIHAEMPYTAYALPYTGGDVQVLGGQGMGLNCSIPKVVSWLAFSREKHEANVSLQMRQACAYHDYCYRHGAATYGYTQSDCDQSLLEHAYRICRYIYGSDRGRDYCVTTARKVAIGVWAGGNASFKTVDFGSGTRSLESGDCQVHFDRFIEHRCASTYFEFDPYPVRAQGYTVYRIADAPSRWIAEGSHRKALYTFEHRPTGVHVSITGWSKDDGRRFCSRLSLPMQYDFMNAPVQIARLTTSEGAIKDVFVWWRRYSFDGTGGRLDWLLPSAAKGEDWSRIFPGTGRIDKNDGCPIESSPVNASSGWAQIGWSAADDNNFSEIHPYRLDAAGDGRFGLLALRTNHCGSGGNALCFVDMRIDLQKEEQRSEPLVARDAFNAPTKEGKARRDIDRYRNFVASPIEMSGTDKKVLGWLRRGETDGFGFEKHALLRRVTWIRKDDGKRVSNLGCNAGAVALLDLKEANEPLAILRRGTLTPSLLSISVFDFDPDGPLSDFYPVSFKVWNLPAPMAYDEKNCVDRLLTEAEKRIDKAPSHELQCDTPVPLNGTWLRQPAVLLTVKGSETTRIVFKRIIAPPGWAGQVDLTGLKLEMREAIIAGGKCNIRALPSVHLPYTNPGFWGEIAGFLKRDGESTAYERRSAYAYRRVRSAPVLLADLNDDGVVSIIHPHPAQPLQPFVAKLD
jgi:hypothetical protein